MTAIELLGNPAEMYKFGTQFWTIVFAFLFVTPITTQFYLPVFMKLRLTSSFEVSNITIKFFNVSIFMKISFSRYDF